jgi:hypothetical protein
MVDATVPNPYLRAFLNDNSGYFFPIAVARTLPWRALCIRQSLDAASGESLSE